MSNLDNSQEQINKIMGYGQKLEVLIGKNSNGEDLLETYHFTPVSLEKIPDLSKKINLFLEKTQNGNFNDVGVLNTAAEIIKISLNKMHPNITIKEIKEKFSLGALAKAVKIIMDTNDFLTEMQAMATINQTSQK